MCGVVFPSSSCLAWGHPALGSVGFMVGLMVNSKRVKIKGNLPNLMLWVPPSLWWAPASPHLHRRPSNTSRLFGFYHLWGHCSFLLYVGVHKILFVPSKGFPAGSDSKETDCNAGYLGPISGLGRSPGEGNGNPLQYSCLENPMDGGAWWATVHGVPKNQIQLRD